MTLLHSFFTTYLKKLHPFSCLLQAQKRKLGLLGGDDEPLPLDFASREGHDIGEGNDVDSISQVGKDRGKWSFSCANMIIFQKVSLFFEQFIPLGFIFF